MFDWLIVGAGFTGATLAERIATQLNQKVLIVERRNHIGGNVYDCYDEHGILIHKYGPHIFHTNNKEVWHYLSKFTEWRPYYHQVLAVIDGQKVPLPFNLNSLYALFPPRYAEKLADLLIAHYGFGAKIPIFKLRASSERELQFLADYIYEKVFYNYTKKQWGLEPEELDQSVTGRVPILVNRDNRYFQDRYQAIPRYGYGALIKRMLSHPNIKILLNTNFKEVENEISYNKVIYTGPIDEPFDYIHGPLPYRSLTFDFINLDKEWHQEVGTINYPNEYDFTRITEYKHLTGQQHPKTSLSIEYPQQYQPGKNEPYYPIPQDESRKLFMVYKKEADKIKTSVFFAGRLGDYKYYNMDQAVARALELFEKEIIR